MNALRMGEHALHYLEGLGQPAEGVWDQLMPCAFSVAAIVLAQAPCANLPSVAATVDRSHPLPPACLPAQNSAKPL